MTMQKRLLKTGLKPLLPGDSRGRRRGRPKNPDYVGYEADGSDEGVLRQERAPLPTGPYEPPPYSEPWFMHNRRDNSEYRATLQSVAVIEGQEFELYPAVIDAEGRAHIVYDFGYILASEPGRTVEGVTYYLTRGWDTEDGKTDGSVRHFVPLDQSMRRPTDAESMVIHRDLYERAVEETRKDPHKYLKSCIERAKAMGSTEWAEKFTRMLANRMAGKHDD